MVFVLFHLCSKIYNCKLLTYVLTFVGKLFVDDIQSVTRFTDVSLGYRFRSKWGKTSTPLTLSPNH